MNMMNKCAKFHKDSPNDKKLNSICRARLIFRRRPFLCTTLNRNLMQASNFGGTSDQLFLWIFLWNFHRRCLSTFSISWCKKVKNDQKLKSRGSCLKRKFQGRTFFFFQKIVCLQLVHFKLLCPIPSRCFWTSLQRREAWFQAKRSTTTVENEQSTVDPRLFELTSG